MFQLISLIIQIMGYLQSIEVLQILVPGVQLYVTRIFDG